MFGTEFDFTKLRECLLDIEQVELKAMRLLQGQPQLTTGGGQVPRDQLIDAVTEIVEYTNRCANAAHQLADLAPMPILTVSMMEFGL